MAELMEQVYDIIIVDYGLPGMDGLEFLKRIHEYHTNALKILITAYGSKEVVSEAHKIGVQDFIEKPFTTRKHILEFFKCDMMSVLWHHA